MNAGNIIEFWLKAGPSKWFVRDDSFDIEIREQFGDLFEEASNGGLKSWEETPEGRRALILVLDQFSRNLMRESARAFEQDSRALKIAGAALDAGDADLLDNHGKQFLYMPYMHSEDLAAQEKCVELFSALGIESVTKYAIIHRDIIAEFGRFPHRNPVLGRTMTKAEQAYLDEGGFSA